MTKCSLMSEEELDLRKLLLGDYLPGSLDMIASVGLAVMNRKSLSLSTAGP